MLNLFVWIKQNTAQRGRGMKDLIGHWPVLLYFSLCLLNLFFSVLLFLSHVRFMLQCYHNSYHNSFCSSLCFSKFIPFIPTFDGICKKITSQYRHLKFYIKCGVLKSNTIYSSDDSISDNNDSAYIPSKTLSPQSTVMST